MPKTPSDRLYKLIKSLSGPEKRYFKLFAQKGSQGKSKYLRLFDAIEAQENFDDEALQNLIYAGESVESRKFSELKGYLYSLLLQSLQAYDEKSSVDHKLEGMHLQARALFRRGHFADCIDLLRKTIRLAGKYERYTSVLQVLDWRLRVAYAQADIDLLAEKLDELEAESRLWRDKLENFQSYRFLFLRIYAEVRQLGARSVKESSRLKTIMNHPLLADPESALSFRARIHFHRIWSVYWYAAGDYKGFLKASETIIGLLEGDPVFLRDDPSIYISALNNLAIANGLKQQYDQVEACLRKLKSVHPKTLDDELKIHRQYYANAFRLYIMKGEFEEGYEAMERHIVESAHYPRQLFERSSFYFQYFYIYFGSGRYDQALEYLNRWLDLPRTVERQDLQALARVLNLIIHYELGNHLLMDSLLRSTARFLNKQGESNELESLIVNAFRELPKKRRHSERRAVFQSLRDSMIQRGFATSPKGGLQQLFDFEAWLECKISGRPFPEVVQEKFRRRT